MPFRWIISRVTAKSNPTKTTHFEEVILYYCHNSRKLHQNAGTWCRPTRPLFGQRRLLNLLLVFRCLSGLCRDHRVLSHTSGVACMWPVLRELCSDPSDRFRTQESPPSGGGLSLLAAGDFMEDLLHRTLFFTAWHQRDFFYSGYEKLLPHPQLLWAFGLSISKPDRSKLL